MYDVVHFKRRDSRGGDKKDIDEKTGENEVVRILMHSLYMEC